MSIKTILPLVVVFGSVAAALTGCGSDPAEENADVVRPEDVQEGQRTPTGMTPGGGEGEAEASATPETNP